MTQNYIELMYLEYFNNYLTVEKFAEHYAISEDLAQEIIKQGSRINNNEMGNR